MRFILSVVLSLAIAGCGGGGGGVRPDNPPPVETGIPFPYGASGSYDIAGLPRLTTADARQMPVYHDGNRLLVGVDQGVRGLQRLTVASDRGDIEIRHGRAIDGVGSAVVAEYLNNDELTWYVVRPTVRLIGDNTRPEDIQRIYRAVQLVNTALPEWAKISVSGSRPESHEGFAGNVSRSGIYYASGTESGVIYIEVITRSEYKDDSYTAVGTAWSWPRGDGSIDHSYIQLVEDYARSGDEFAHRLVAHEIIHALGVAYHVPMHMASIMDRRVTADSSQPLSVLYPADREALRAIYSGSSAKDYGPWESSSFHIVGVSSGAAFGVALRNGYAEPWAYGYRPKSDLSSNRALGGNATWTGALLGLTPQASAVAGDARIGINLATMDGRADFTALESFPEGQAPGDSGTGTQWLDGDLGYTIAVSGNTFRQTGGDDGRVTGIFVGRSHEGATGTLERSDLTAAFGASR